MKINDETAKFKYIESTNSISMGPLTWLLKLFALNCNCKSYKTSLIVFKSFIAALILGTLTFSSLYYKLQHIYQSIGVSIWLTDAVQMIYDYCQYIVDLYFIYKYGRSTTIVYFKHYECIDKMLNIVDNSSVKGELTKLLGFFTLIWIISSACDFAAWVLGYGWIVPVVYSVSYIFLFIKILTILNLTTHVMFIEVRLNTIGNILENFYSSVYAAPVKFADCLSDQNWLYSAISSTSNPRQLKPHFDEQRQNVKSIIRCYLLLTEQVAFINNMHGFRIVLNSLSLLIDMVRYANLAIRVGTGSQQIPHVSVYFPAVANLMRLLTCVVMILSLATYCERAYRQKERILNIIDHLLINKNPGENLRREVTQLRDFVQQRSITFNGANVFDINYSMLVSIASVVVTYTIILLQSVN